MKPILLLATLALAACGASVSPSTMATASSGYPRSTQGIYRATQYVTANPTSVVSDPNNLKGYYPVTLTCYSIATSLKQACVSGSGATAYPVAPRRSGSNYAVFVQSSSLTTHNVDGTVTAKLYFEGCGSDTFSFYQGQTRGANGPYAASVTASNVYPDPLFSYNFTC